jgi:outer membrane protein OmpA-like peptidoglycan-associated protein
LGAPDIKRPVRRSMWWLRAHFLCRASLENVSRKRRRTGLFEEQSQQQPKFIIQLSGRKKTMSVNKSKRLQVSTMALTIVLALACAAFAQDNTASQSGSANTGSQSSNRSTSSRSVASGQKMNVKGVVTSRDIDADTFVVQDVNGVSTTVRLTDRTSVKSKGGFFGGGSTYGPSNILRGLNLEVEGRGDASGNLVAEKVRFGSTDLRVAQSIQARVDPVENRVGSAENRIGQVEQNSQRLSGQLDELAAVANAAGGGAKAAQETADAAVSGVNMTNERISALDDYVAQQTVNVNFSVGSAVLTPTAKTTLDQIAQQALKARGYVLEVRGFASADGSESKNRMLSQRRADAVVQYLAYTHNIPLRRIVTPFGYGEQQAVADNTTREGRQQNRRVEVSVLVNRGLMQSAPNMSTAKPDAAATPEQ